LGKVLQPKYLAVLKSCGRKSSLPVLACPK
jgi:hypothetical protein